MHETLPLAIPPFFSCKGGPFENGQLLTEAGGHLKEDEVQLGQFLVEQQMQRKGPKATSAGVKGAM